MIKEIAFVAYPSKDVAALRAWYEKHLDLTFGPAYTEGGVEQYAEAEIATRRWLDERGMGRDPCRQRRRHRTRSRRHRRGYGEAARRRLEVEDPYVTPVCKLASFHDLEGNKLTLHQRTATEWVAHD